MSSREPPPPPPKLRNLPGWFSYESVADSVALAGWGVHVAFAGFGTVAAALVRGSQACELTCTVSDDAGTVEMRLVCGLGPDGQLPDSGPDRPAAAAHRQVQAAGRPVAEAVTEMVLAAGMWWPTPASRERIRAELVRLLVVDAAARLRVDVTSDGEDDPRWASLPGVLPHLVDWAVAGEGTVLPCPHPLAAQEVASRLGPEDPSPQVWSEAERLVGRPWVDTALVSRWSPRFDQPHDGRG